MNVFKVDSRPNVLSFTNYERISEDALYQQAKALLDQNSSISWGRKISGPSEELQEGSFDGLAFTLINDLDYGVEIHSDSEDAIWKFIEYFNDMY